MAEIENPVLTQLRNRKDELLRFINYLDGNMYDKQPVKLSVNFKHRKFCDTTGYAMLNMNGIHIDNIIWKLKKACEEELAGMIKEIERYERSEEKHRGEA